MQNFPAMRWIISTLLLGTMALPAAEPADAVLQFLRDLKERAETAEDDERFAISPFCGPLKKEAIKKHWNNRALWLRENQYDLSVLAQTRDKNLAAIVMGLSTEGNPESTAVISLGVVRQGEVWKIAPVEGRFDNTGLGFGASIQERTKSLEVWMSPEKVDGLARLRSKARENFRKKMTGQVDLETLKVEDPEEAVNHFLEAAYEGNVDALLVWQGILERDQLSDRDWDRAIRATRLGMASTDDRSAWRLLKSNRVMKVIMAGQGDSEEADYLVCFLSSFRTDPRNENLNPVRFRLTMTDVGWRINLPTFLSFDQEDLRTHQRAFNEEFDWEDSRTAKQMGRGFEIENDKFRSADPESLLKSVIADLKNGTLHPFLTKLYREEEEFDDEEEVDEEEEAEEEERPILPQARRANGGDFEGRRLDRYREAVLWWSGILGRDDTIEARVQKIYREGDLALALLVHDDSNRDWRPSRETIWLAKEKEGWMVLADPLEVNMKGFDPALEEIRKKLAAEFEEDDKKFDDEYSATLTKELATDDPEGKAIGEEEGVALLKEWRQLARKGTMKDLMKKSAVRKIPAKPIELMTLMGYVRNDASSSKIPDQHLGSRTAGRFVGVSLMVDKGEGIERDCPLMIVAPTKNGTRVLVDIELPLESNKGILLLNEERLLILANELSPGDFAAIKELHVWHQELSRPVWDKWNLEQAARAK
jgi:hypothetical protein